MNKDQVKGRVEQAKGAMKEATGKVVRNRSLEAEGKIDKTTGRARADYGDLKEDVRDAARDAAKSVERSAAERAAAERAAADRAEAQRAAAQRSASGRGDRLPPDDDEL
ncbi:MAG TPA: CsbD family protein [Burkholderiaceae bacterium]